MKFSAKNAPTALRVSSGLFPGQLKLRYHPVQSRLLQRRHHRSSSAAAESIVEPGPYWASNSTRPGPAVTVAGVQEANTLTLSNNANLTIGNNPASPQNSLTVYGNTTCAAGSQIIVDGSLNAQNISLQGLLQVTNGGSAVVGAITGNGAISVGGGAGISTLTVTSIVADSLTIGGSGNLATSSSTSIVPEPASFCLLGCALPVLLVGGRLRRRQHSSQRRATRQTSGVSYTLPPAHAS